MGDFAVQKISLFCRDFATVGDFAVQKISLFCRDFAIVGDSRRFCRLGNSLFSQVPYVRINQCISLKFPEVWGVLN